MDRQPFEPSWSARSQRLKIEIYSARPYAARRQRKSAIRGTDPSPRIAEAVEFAALFEFAPSLPSTAAPSACLHPYTAYRTAYDDGCGLVRPRELQECGGRPINVWHDLEFSNAAQPLQYDPGEGWNDCSSTQEAAGRGNEEMTR